MTPEASSAGIAKPIPIEPPGRRNDRGIDADDLAIHIEERATGIAAIDSSIGLDEIVIRTRVDIAVACRNDTDGHRAAEAKWIADRHDPIADAGLGRIAEFHGNQLVLLRIYLEHGNVGLGILADQFSLQLRAVIEIDFNLVRIGNDVIVGHDDALLGIDDETRSE